MENLCIYHTNKTKREKKTLQNDCVQSFWYDWTQPKWVHVRALQFQGSYSLGQHASGIQVKHLWGLTIRFVILSCGCWWPPTSSLVDLLQICIM